MEGMKQDNLALEGSELREREKWKCKTRMWVIVLAQLQLLTDLTVSPGQSPADWSDDLNDCLLLEQAEQTELLNDQQPLKPLQPTIIREGFIQKTSVT